MELIPLGVYGRYPSKNGACSSYLLKAGEKNILIDFGADSMRELLKEIELIELDAILLTHLHYDHIADALVFQYAREYQGLNVPLYMPAEPAEIKSLFNGDIRDINSVNADFHAVLPIKMRHGRCDSYAISIKSAKTLVYTSDFSDIDEYAEISHGAGIVIGDACVLDEDWSEDMPHVSVASLGRATNESTELFLAHLTDNREGEILEEALRYHKKTRLAIPHDPIIF